MSDEIHAAKLFLTQARERADKILSAEHISADVKSAIRDLLQVVDSMALLKQQSQGQSADARVLKKKLDQAKLELRDLVPKLAALKQALPPLIEDIKQISSEATAIAKRHDGSAQDPDIQSAARIRASTQRMASVLALLSE